MYQKLYASNNSQLACAQIHVMWHIGQRAYSMCEICLTINVFASVIHTVPCSSQHHKQTQGYCSGNPTDLTPTEMKQVKLHVHTWSHDNIIYIMFIQYR